MQLTRTPGEYSAAAVGWVPAMRPPLRDFRVKTIAGFAVVIATTVLAMATASYIGRATNRTLLTIISSHLSGVLAMSRIQFEAEHLVATTRGYLITADDRFLQARTRAEEQLTTSIERLRHDSTEWAQSNNLDEIERLASDYSTTLDRLLAEPSTRASMTSGPELEGELQPIRTALAAALRDALAEKEARVVRAREAIEVNLRDEERITLLIGLLGGGLAVVFGWLASRSLQEMYARERAAVERAQRAVQAKDELLGIVAHDLRSPLTAITMKASLLGSELPDPELKARAESIVSVGKRTGVLVQTLLDAASIEAGRFAVARDRCTLTAILNATLETFESIAAQKAITLTGRIDSQETVLHADRDRMVQALSNLVGNALKFTPKGGRVEVRGAQQCGRVLLTVRDTGPGIPPEHVSRVFERHWSADPQSKTGAGLGLYIARAIIDAHGGRIWATSDDGGAMFHVELPLAPAITRPPPALMLDASNDTVLSHRTD